MVQKHLTQHGSFLNLAIAALAKLYSLRSYFSHEATLLRTYHSLVAAGTRHTPAAILKDGPMNSDGTNYWPVQMAIVQAPETADGEWTLSDGDEIYIVTHNEIKTIDRARALAGYT